MFAVSSDFADPFTFVFSILLAIVLVAAWVILAASRFVQGGVMERPERVPQLYGYTVCLVALLWGIGSLLSLVMALLLFVFHWRWLKRRTGLLPVPLDPRTGRPAGSPELVS